MFGLKANSSPKQAGKVHPVWGKTIDDGVIALAWSPDGSLISVSGATGEIVVFGADDGREAYRLPGHKGGNLALAWRSQGDLLATSGQDGIARLIDSSTGNLHRELTAGENWVGCLAWSLDGAMLATGAGRTLRFWNSEGKQLIDCDKHPSTITDLKWRPSKDLLLASVAYGGVCFWTGDKPSAKHAYEFQGSMLTQAWSPSGKFLAVGNQDSTAIFWEYGSTAGPSAMSGFPAKVHRLSWDSSSRYLITAAGRDACVWDFSGPRGPRGTQPIELPFHDRSITGAAFQHQGGLIATAGEDGRLALWKIGRKEAFVTGVFEFKYPVTAMAWAPDNRTVVCGCESGVVAVLAIE